MQQIDRGHDLQRRDIAGAAQHHVGSAALVVAGEWPDANALGAVLDRGFHIQPLRLRLLAGHDNVDAVPASQAVVGDPKQRVGVGRQVDPGDIRLLVDDKVDKARILVTEAVMILPPYM